MPTDAKGQVPLVGSIEIDFCRVGKDRGIAVGGSPHQCGAVAGAQRLSVQIGVPTHRSGPTECGRAVPQELLGYLR
ncbi:hypothetical protein MUNTM_35220 [Mycobacterium sp. MUNTM1]